METRGPNQIPNPLKMNDWGITKFLSVILAIQLLVLSLILLNTMGIRIPLLWELISLVYLLFVPGILILRVLKLHRLGTIETVLFTIGLSISTIMFTGFIMNMIYPIFGVFKPLSFFYLIIMMSVIVVILSALSYMRDRKSFDPDFIDIKDIISPKVLFLLLVPFLAIFGTYLINFYGNNNLLMILIVVIALIVILVVFNKIPKRLYPLTIFIIAISLLLHSALISTYIWGWDIQQEYYLSSLVVNNSYWDHQLPIEINAMLSVMIFAPILSKIADINLIWVFKVVYPFLFSLIPLGLYEVFRKQSNEKIAFLSTFFFMSIFTFWREMVQLTRQQIAELFLVLLILLMIDSAGNKLGKSVLFIIFAFSIIVSHYGLSYIFMFSLIAAYLIFILMRRPYGKRSINKTSLNNSIEDPGENKNISSLKTKVLTSSFVLLFIIFALSWYLYVSSSSLLERILEISNHIFNSITMDLLDPQAAQGLAALTAEIPTPLHSIPKYLNLIFQVFIVVGFVSLLKFRWNFKKEYLLFALVSLLILFLSIILPYFASSLNMTRLYHITLFFLAPFAIIGGIMIFQIIYRVMIRKNWTKRHLDSSLKILTILVTFLFLFYTGFIYQIFNDNPTSFSLSKADYPVYSQEEIVGAEWLHQKKASSLIYADDFRRPLFTSVAEEPKTIPENYWIYWNSYIYIGKFNTNTNTLLIKSMNKALKESYYVNTDIIIENKSKVYSNGGSQIYYRS